MGADNPFGHPSPEVVERLIDRLGEHSVYRTDQDGTIEFITDGGTLLVKADSQRLHPLARYLQRRAPHHRRIPCKGDNQTVKIARHKACNKSLP